VKTTTLVGLSRDAGKTSYLNYWVAQNPQLSYCLAALGTSRVKTIDNRAICKPRWHIPRGAIFTALSLSVKSFTGLLEVIAVIQPDTPLGPVCLYRTKARLEVQSSGPNHAAPLIEVHRIARAWGCRHFIIDSALDRKAPLDLEFIDEMILAVGNDSPQDTFADISAQIRYWSLITALPPPPFPIMATHSSHPQSFSKNGRIIRTFDFPFLGKEPLIIRQLIEDKSPYLYLPASFTRQSWEKISALYEHWRGNFIVPSVFKIHLSLPILNRLDQKINVIHSICFDKLVVNSYSTQGAHRDCREWRHRFRSVFPQLNTIDISEITSRS